MLHQPIFLYVSLDTLRDYLYVDDASVLVVDGLDLLRREHAAGTGPTVVTKILSSGWASTVASILGEVRRITKSPVKVVMAVSPTTRYQTSDLRMNSGSGLNSTTGRRPL